MSVVAHTSDNLILEMKQVVFVSLGACVLAALAGGTFFGVQQYKRYSLHESCKSSLAQLLKDPQSYQQITDLTVFQAVGGQPTVYTWKFNAKNSMGGYVGASEALCFTDQNGFVSSYIVDPESPGFTQDFLGRTNPEIARQRQEYLKQITAEHDAKTRDLNKWADQQTQWADAVGR